VRPNAATVEVRQVEEGYLYRLDKETQAVVARVMEWTRDHEGEEGGVIDMEEEAAKKERLKGRKGKGDEGEEEEGGLELVLPQARLGVPVLQRLRRQYIQLQRLEPSAAGRIREGFVGFLNAAFEKM
jgi:protein KTI12